MLFRSGWLLAGAEEPSEPQSLASSVADRMLLQVAAFPLIGHIRGYFPAQFHHKEKIRRFQHLLRSACEYASDGSLGLVLIHLPTPHPPAIYSRTEKRFTAGEHVSYLDSVALADVALGEIRRSIDRAGLSGNTAIIVSADHGWRTNMWRGGPEWTAEEESASLGINVSGVPFLAMLPRMTEPVAYSESFDTIVTSRMIMGILEKKIESPAQIAELIRRQPRP